MHHHLHQGREMPCQGCGQCWVCCYSFSLIAADYGALLLHLQAEQSHNQSHNEHQDRGSTSYTMPAAERLHDDHEDRSTVNTITPRRIYAFWIYFCSWMYYISLVKSKVPSISCTILLILCSCLDFSTSAGEKRTIVSFIWSFPSIFRVKINMHYQWLVVVNASQSDHKKVAVVNSPQSNHKKGGCGICTSIDRWYSIDERF